MRRDIYYGAALPIDARDLDGFHSWVLWNGFHENHRAFDFAAYLSKDGIMILGLPEKTPIRAIADGIVAQVAINPYEAGNYFNFVNIEHGEGTGRFSSYHHVIPLVRGGQSVKRGESIATLYKDPGDTIGRLVHLHFEICREWGYRERGIDPAILFPELARISCVPQGALDFTVEGLTYQPKVEIANFQELRVGCARRIAEKLCIP